MSDYCRVLPIGTRQDSSVPLFLLRSDLFLRTSSSLFACTGRVTWLNHKTKTGGSVGGDRIRVHREASKRRTRVGIIRLASRLSEVRSPCIRPMVLRREFPKCPSGVCVLVLCNRGIFRLSPYILRGERMASNSRNPSSFPFAIFATYFP
jgi:hypothetical protein